MLSQTLSIMVVGWLGVFIVIGVVVGVVYALNAATNPKQK